MFKWLGQWRETGKQPKASSSASVRSILKTAVADAEQIVASIKMKAQAEAEEEAARIIAQASQEAEKVKREAETVVEKGVEDILAVANRKAESTEAEVEPAALSGAGEEIEKVEEPVLPQGEVIEEKVEEPVLPQGEVIEEKVEEPVLPQGEVIEEKIEEPVLPRDEVTVSEPVTVAEEELLEPSLPEEKPGRKGTKPDSLKQDSHSLYTGEVELAVAKPVDLKMVSKLYNYLQVTPEIKLAHTSGSWDRGTTITVTLDKPIPLISVLSSKIPEAKITPERPEMDGFVKGKRGVRRIKLALK